jgi:hypothetical protein
MSLNSPSASRDSDRHQLNRRDLPPVFSSEPGNQISLRFAGDLVNRFLICCALGLLLWSSAPAMGAGVAEVVYDRNQDRIAIQAKDVTLAQLFAQLAQKAGIESRIDATVAGDLLSVNQPLRPTTEVFQRLLGRYSYTLHYRTMAKNRRQLSAVTILGPAGKTGSGTSLPSVRHVSGERGETAGVAPASIPPGTAAGSAGGMARVPSGANALDAEQAQLMSQPVPSAVGNTLGQPGGSVVPHVTTTAAASAAAGAATGVPALVPPPAIPAKRIGPDGRVID